MPTSRPDNRPWMSSHNSDQPNPRNLMTTSQLVQGSPASSLSRNCSAFFDSVTLHRQDQFVDPCSMWRLGCSSNHTALDQPHGVIEKRGQPVHGYYFVKAEQEDFFPATMGLNLAGTGTTTYSGGASEETSQGNRFFRTGISACAGSQIPQCQAEGCKANLSSAKHYHRRHKVCEMHSKASTAVVGGLIQRFCQQCSRFHPRSEFDEGKRSCRKRLADHNRRRRKPQPSPCTASQCQAGTTGRLENENQKSKGSSGHDATDVQITANINTSTSTAPSVMASVPMMMFPNTYKGQIPVLQGTSIDKKSCVEFLYASIAQTGSDLSLERRIISDNQIESSAYELVHPCSLRPGLLGSEIAGRFSRPAPVDTRYSQSLISMKNTNSNHVTESSKSSLNLPISSSSNDIPVALSSMKNGCSNWILHGSSAEGIRTHAKIPGSAESMRSAYDPTPRNDVIKWDAV